jgi:nitrate/TMAO reductase-like tetraheme cytochrome c subunit
MSEEQSMTETRRVPSLARNFLSSLGLVIALIALANIAFLVFVDFGAKQSNPYVGIFAYVLLPGVLCFGLAVFVLGMLRERSRRRRHAPDEVAPYPDINLNNPHTRRVVAFWIVGITVFVLISVVGSYKAYHYTDSDQFCGTTCHQVMHPEYTAYKASPHARVGCVNCHIGSGATWYVKSKFSGAYQVYSTLAHKYPRPIPSPVHNLRPAQETCEQCHWPEKFWGAQLKVFNHFGYDEQNTPRETRMLIKTGGGSPTTGPTTGIHWHMNIANKITYVASDDKRQTIEWVRVEGRDGRVTEYRMNGSKLTPQQIASMPQRRMDCIDCHNRPTHIYMPPDRAVDRALLSGRLDRTLPFMKQQAVTALTKDYKSTDEGLKTIAADLQKYYAPRDVRSQVATLQEIFQTIRFPEMNVDWRTHPDNIGHFYTLGCFRCHDDQHVSKEGKTITKDCQACHTLLGQEQAGVVMVEAPKADFQHPVDIGDLREMTCAECHTGSSM